MDTGDTQQLRSYFARRSGVGREFEETKTKQQQADRGVWDSQLLMLCFLDSRLWSWADGVEEHRLGDGC